MTRRPRGLSPEEAALWERVAGTVKPLKGPGLNPNNSPIPINRAEVRPNISAKSRPIAGAAVGASSQHRIPTPLRPLTHLGLDASWERKLAKAQLDPDFTLDLHGHSLDAAHRRLDHGLALAIAQQARVVLVITGRPRPVEAADRGAKRGAIRAKLLDWLALGSHASRIAAVRPAHPRHGGAGAVYVVLRRIRA